MLLAYLLPPRGRVRKIVNTSGAKSWKPSIQECQESLIIWVQVSGTLQYPCNKYSLISHFSLQNAADIENAINTQKKVLTPISPAFWFKVLMETSKRHM